MTHQTMSMSPRKLAIPEWKKFWSDRRFALEMKQKGIVSSELPLIMNRLFHTGPYFLLVVDYRDMSFDYVAGATQAFGYTKEHFYSQKLDFLPHLIHPDDVEKVLGLAVHFYHFLDLQPGERRLDFKASINFRLRKGNGEYAWVIEQVVGLNLDDSGKITHALKYFTDISHLNYSNEIVLSLLDDRDENNQTFYTFNIEEKRVEQQDQSNATFSAREKEVLALIARGLTTKEIASELGISRHTVNKHRENLMKKTGSKNITEVINFAHCNEYL